MFRVELGFDTNNLDVEEICERTDEIFAKHNMPCESKTVGRRVYTGTGDKNDFGKLWAAIFDIDSAPQITNCLTEGIWFNGRENEDLLTDFFRSKRRNKNNG
jgi:hypothetical protein